MKRYTLLPIITFTVVAASAAFGAWEEVPLPAKEGAVIGWMEFARPDLGYACITDPPNRGRS